jgi:hypothetical protein
MRIEVVERDALVAITLTVFLRVVVLYLIGRGGLNWRVCCAWGPGSYRVYKP